MTTKEIVRELEAAGADSYKKVLLKHGIKEPVFGVKVEHLKKIQKRVKQDYKLALELFDSGIYDAMYLAGLIADDARMTKDDLNHWAEKANCPTLSAYTVPWVAAESPHGWEMARKWIESKSEGVATAGWATLGGLVALKEDSELDLATLKRLLQRVQTSIHQQPDRVRLAMNRFVTEAGTYSAALMDAALQAAERIGAVQADMGDTACKVPDAAAAIQKAQKRGAIGKKRKTVKC